MKNKEKLFTVLLRLTLGWLFFYAGFTKVIDPSWSAVGYLNNVENFTSFYHWLASPEILPVVDLLNQWGLTLIGLTLILGVWVRFSAILGAIIMILYYLALDWVYPNSHSFVVDDHIIYAISLLLLASLEFRNSFGLSVWLNRKSN